MKKLAEQFDVKGFIENLDPNQKRWAVIIVAICGFFLVMTLFTDDGSTGASNANRQDTIRHVLTDADTRKIGIDALAAQVKTVTKEKQQLERTVDRLQTEIQDLKKRRGNDPDVMREIERLRSQMGQISNAVQETGWKVEDIEDGYTGTAKTDSTGSIFSGLLPERDVAKKEEPAPKNKIVVGVDDQLDTKNPNYYFENAPAIPSVAAPVSPGTAPGSTQAGLQIVTVTQQQVTGVDGAEEEGTYIPSGSILTGVLLSGLDAPTNQSARREPFPVILRVQKEAVLPNRYSADIRECFLLLSGYGDLSSERAYLRGETLSCVRNDEAIIESQLDSYAVGEDGKAGIRGRVVSKQGQIIAKSLVAGFAAGVAEAFGSSPVPVIQTGNVSGDKTYQPNFSSDALKYGASQGASEALSKVADFYLEMAENIFPVIEVDAGRQVEVVVTRGSKLKVRGK